LEEEVPQKSRKEEIITAISDFLIDAVKGREPITDERLMEAADCARATFYKYVTKGSEIENKIEKARAEQERYLQSLTQRNEGIIGADSDCHKRLIEAETGARELLAFVPRFIANLIRRNVKIQDIQAAQREAMPHPNRDVSHAGKGRRRR
jgi:hypothetical protein